jgi:asparagine synthase (glutamine-hydrolysing)
MSGWLESRLTGHDNPLARLMRPEFLDRTVRSYLTSWRKSIRPLDEIQTHRIWMLLCLESWLRHMEEKLGVRLEL